jgi:hypothetical protein
MSTKALSIFCCTLMFAAAVLPLTEAINNKSTSLGGTLNQTDLQKEMQNQGSRDGWTLQWSHAYGGNGHSEFAQPVGDLDGDGRNEFVIGGYENSGICRIMYYNTTQKTYVQKYAWQEAGGDPSGACIADLNGDGSLILVVSWVYSSADGVYAYKFDGTTLTKLDWYHGIGTDFVYDVYAVDYNQDGNLEVLISNAPYYGGHTQHVIALGWDTVNQQFYYETAWSCPGGANMECCMVSSGDVFNNGKTTIIADVTNHNDGTTAGTWALTWNTNNQSWDAMQVWNNYGGAGVYGSGVADINGDGTPEIGVGSDNTPQGWLFEWDGTTFHEVWNGQYPGQYSVIESVALGDADNDGHNEFCFGTGHVHIIGWNGTGYYEKATLTDPTYMLAGMNIGDFDTDGKNELKGCEIIGGTGSEFIWKYIQPDTTPPVTTCHLEGQMNGNIYISNVTVTLTATDNGSGVDFTKYKLDTGSWMTYTAPFLVTTDGDHVLSFYSQDNAGNVEATQNATFTIMHHPDVTLTVKGGFGFSLTIMNSGSISYTKLPWGITLDGKHIMKGKTMSGTILSLDPGKTRTFKDKVFGFGKTGITVDVGGVQKTYTAFVFLIFVIGVK